MHLVFHKKESITYSFLAFDLDSISGRKGQSVTCLTADPGVTSLILAQCNTFAEIDHEIISTAILLPSADSRRVVVSYKRKYVHKVLVNSLVKLAHEKSVVKWTDRPNMTLAVDWDVKHQTKETEPI